MTFAELLGQLLGWLGDFIEWVFGWMPRYRVVYFNEMGAKYVMGDRPTAVGPGVWWYIKNLSKIEVHYTERFVQQVKPVCVETKDGIPVVVGMVYTGKIVDIIKYEVENLNADDNMDELAQGVLRDFVTEHTWDELRRDASDGSRFGNKLKTRVEGTMAEKFGVRIETARPTDQVRLNLRQGAVKLFR